MGQTNLNKEGLSPRDSSKEMKTTSWIGDKQQDVFEWKDRGADSLLAQYTVPTSELDV